MRPIIVDTLAGLIGRDAAILLAPGYFTMVALAALATTIFLVRRARRDGDDVSSLLEVLMLGYAAAVAGGILLPILIDAAAQALAGRVPRLRWAGMVAYGGFGGAVLAITLYLRRSRAISPARLGDLLAPVVGLSVAIVRLGCFVAGCDYGQVSSLPWAIRFPAGSPAWRDHVQAGLVPAWRDASLPVHPTQLYEALFGLALFLLFAALLARRRARGAAPGALLPLALAAYALGRAGIETLRGDGSRGFLGPLSTSQAIGLGVLAAVAVVLWRRRRRAAPVALAAGVALLVAASPAPAHARDWQGGLLVGSTHPLNRRGEQVPQLLGGGLFVNLDATPGVTVGFQLELMQSAVAAHRSAAVDLVFRRAQTDTLDLGFRFGVGATSIDFLDPSFGSLAGMDLRLAGTIDYQLAGSWVATIWPVALDFVATADTGGPIFSYQFRFGLTYTFGGGSRGGQAPPPEPGRR